MRCRPSQTCAHRFLDAREGPAHCRAQQSSVAGCPHSPLCSLPGVVNLVPTGGWPASVQLDARPHCSTQFSQSCYFALDNYWRVFPSHLFAPPPQVLCPGGHQCVDPFLLCSPHSANEQPSCVDGSDRDPSFCRQHTCPDSYSKCSDGVTCVPDFFFCDGTDHCPGGLLLLLVLVLVCCCCCCCRC